MAAGLTFFNEVFSMSISNELMGGLLGRFALLFPLHEEAKSNFAILPEIWVNLLSDFSENEVLAAARALALKLKRFPIPADFVEQIKTSRAEEEETHG